MLEEKTITYLQYESILKLFEDIKVHSFALKFYQDVYHVDENTAKALRSEQLLDWTVENDF